MASKRRLKRRSCLSKIKHTSEYSALGHKYALGQKIYQSYHCQFCGGWHVGRPRGMKPKWIKFTYN